MPLRRRIKNAIKKALGKQTKQESAPQRSASTAPTKPSPPPSAFPSVKAPEPPKETAKEATTNPVAATEPTPPEDVPQVEAEIATKAAAKPQVVEPPTDPTPPPDPSNPEPNPTEGTTAEPTLKEEAPAEVPSEPEEVGDVSAPPSTDTPTVDASGATFVYEISYLFPEKCPSCGAPSYNNWIRGDTYFACGSCNTPY